MDGSEYKTLYNFLQSKEYPDNSTLNEKRALRKIADHFNFFLSTMADIFFLIWDKISPTFDP
jgi:hypothetical protein